tara:strand:+ start:4369 stop:4638 length:270 start_codon:yes stop_codon:yes gene_type:complete
MNNILNEINKVLSLDLQLLNKYKETINNGLIISTMFIVFHLLIYFSVQNGKYNYGINGSIFNKNMINTLIFLIISYLAYDLVIKEIIYL